MKYKVGTIVRMFRASKPEELYYEYIITDSLEASRDRGTVYRVQFIHKPPDFPEYDWKTHKWVKYENSMWIKEIYEP